MFVQEEVSFLIHTKRKRDPARVPFVAILVAILGVFSNCTPPMENQRQRFCTNSRDCLAGEFCVQGLCSTQHPHEVSETSACDGGACNQKESVENTEADCLEDSDCSQNSHCVQRRCVPRSPSCTNQCPYGEKRCTSGGYPVQCELKKDGCTDWIPLSPCPARHTCKAGICKVNCQNQCSAGDTRCGSTSSIDVCRTLSSGCLGWETLNSCGNKETCQGGKCTNIYAQENEDCSRKSCDPALSCIAFKGDIYQCMRRCAKSSDCSSGWYCYDTSNGPACLIPQNGAPRDYLYKLEAISASIGDYGGNVAWDPWGGAPDLYVYLEIAGTTYSSNYVSDSKYATWNYSFPGLYTASQIASMKISLWDDDTDSDDKVSEWSSITITKPNPGVVTLSDSAKNVYFFKIRITGIPQ